MAKKNYLVLNGLSYTPFKAFEEKHVAPGNIVNDIPHGSIPWLLEQGHIEEVQDTLTLTVNADSKLKKE